MDHSMHSNHEMPMDPEMPHDMCSMNMLFTWDWKNSCIVFKWWHVKTFNQFILTFIILVILSMGYEFSRYLYVKKNKAMDSLRVFDNSDDNFIDYESTTNHHNQDLNQPPINYTFEQLKSIRFKKSLFYAWQVGYSFMLMLVFMTYNGWYMIAVVLGAGLGNYTWGHLDDIKSMSCH